MSADVHFDVHSLSVKKNFFLWTNPEDPFKALRQAKAIYDPARYARMIEGKSVPEAGHDFYNFERAIHVFDGQAPGVPCTPLVWQSDDLWLSHDSSWTGPGTVEPHPEFAFPFIAGVDPGATVMSAVIGSVSVDCLHPYASGSDLTYENTTLVVTHELQKRDTSVVDFIQTMLRPAGFLPGTILLFCDPSSLARDHTNGESPVDVLRAHGYDVAPIPSGSRRLSGINAIRTRLHMQRLLIHKSCGGLVVDMTKVKSIGRTQQDVSRDPHGHRPDCLRYLVTGIWPERNALRPENLPGVIGSYHR